MSVTTTNGLRVALFGATGLAGSGVLRACLDDDDVAAVHAISRRDLGVEDARLTTHLCDDFADLSGVADAFEGIDVVLYCLGISASKVDGEAAYRVITYDYALEAANTLKAHSPEATFHFVSGAMTHAESRMMWARVKGETELALGEVGLGGLVCWRPGAIHRGGGAWRLLGGWRRTVHHAALGQAMLQATREERRDGTIENPEIRDYADRYQGVEPRRGRGCLTVAAYALLMVVALVTVVLVDGWSAFGHAPSGEDAARMTKSPQWDAAQDVFENEEPMFNDYDGMWKEMADASELGSPEVPPKVETIDPKRFATPPESGLRVTWFGHSSMLIEIEGRTFLTDPLWGGRVSPLSWVGPKHWYPPPIALEALPKLDAVVISHDHYDHLDAPTIKHLAARDVPFIVPMGVSSHLAYWGIPKERIIELDWWQTHAIGDVTVACTPARHASGRFIGGENKTLWAGYAFVGKKRRAFFSGDTGLFPKLTEIGKRYGPFDVTMLEVGAYGQSWPDWHLGPEQAVRAHRMLRGKVLLPVHWGLVNLAYHAWTEPIERTLVAAEQHDVPVLTPRPGGSVEPTERPKTARWWPDVPWRTAAQYPIVATRVPPE